MVTREELGVGYLFGAGIAILSVIVVYYWFASQALLVSLIGVLTAAFLASSMIYVGYWLLRNEFPGSYVWNVARWCAIGLGLATLFTIVVMATPYYFPGADLLPGFFITAITTGGVLGVLFGSVTELRKQYRRIRELNQQNTVLNRVLRHNIRNDMNVILGRAEDLDQNGNGDATAVDTIRRKAMEVIRLSDAARDIDALHSSVELTQMDVGGLARRVVAAAETSYPDAEIDAAVPDSAWASVSPVFESALDNVIENAIQHNTESPRVHVAVDRDATDDAVTITVGDNGPGIPQQQLDILFADGETQVRHGNGLGLWLTKWIVESCDGELAIETSEAGTTVTITVPGADPGPSTEAVEDVPADPPTVDARP